MPRQMGLMFRESMAGDHGMLFVATEPHQHSFWMKNTKIPLDIGYFAFDGTTPGARLDLEALAASIEQRGLPAIAFGLE